MTNQQLLDYIKQQLQQGVSREIITNNLISQGWQQPDVNEAFSQSSGQSFSAQTNPSFAVGDATKNKKATTGLVLGIIGLIAWFIPIIGAPITIIGLIFSIIGLKSLKRGVATAGIVLCSIGLLATIVNASIGAYQGATGQNYFVNKFLNKENQSPQTGTTQSTQPSNNGVTSKTELINQAVQEVKAQLPLPDKLDEVTTMVDVTAEPSAIRYHYVLSGVDTSEITNELLKNSLGPNVCQDKDTKNLLYQDINLEYSYSVENSTQKYFVSFTKTDCK
jgi:hypothetical protein